MHCAIVAVVVAFASLDSGKTNAEVRRWAEEMTVHFFNAAFTENYTEALGFATEDFCTRLRTSAARIETGRDEAKGLLDLFWPAHCAVAPYGQPKNIRIVARAGSLSPTGDEMFVRGEVWAGKGSEATTKARFTAIVVKTAAGKWKVSSVALVVVE